MDIDTLIDGLREDPATQGQIMHAHRMAPREAQYAAPEAPMHPRLSARLEHLGLDKLYTHQAHAYDAAMREEDVVVVTGTNSGKTLCYNLPAVQYELTEPMARAIYLYPTKALAQDQLGKLDQLIPGRDIKAATYDGDTPANRRGTIRKSAHMILTNPDMLHVGILPAHEQWDKFLKSLRLIVIDEIHVYRGVFGSHVAGILRRLLRLCEWRHNRPQIIACSATIGNPEELFEKLTGRKARLIAEDGAPRAKRTFLFWNPPMLDKEHRASANATTATLLTQLGQAGLRSLAFSRARISAELVLRHSRSIASSTPALEPEQFESYRAGYTPQERRHIEQALFKGELIGLSSTNAMELGVDVGGLDAVLMNGYPGTISSFWQQAGRAGRGSRDGLAIMIAHDDPLEQFLIRDPDLILSADTESVALNPENPQILSQQLRCAAFERPLSASDLGFFGASALDTAESLDRAGELQFQSGRFYYPSHEPPARLVNIRGGGKDQIKLLVDGKELGTMEYWRALQNAHEGAVYLHRGASYKVLQLDLAMREAHLQSGQYNHYTQAMVQSVIETGPSFGETDLGVFEIAVRGLKVTDMVTGYRVKSLDGDTVLGVHDLELPPQTYETVGLQFDLRALSMEDMPRDAGGVHGLEHTLMAIAPLIAGTDRGDLGSAWYSIFPATFAPAVFVFDRTPGGVGLSEKLFAGLQRWLGAAYSLLHGCSCANGCPSCLMSARCESNNEVLDKTLTEDLLLRAL